MAKIIFKDRLNDQDQIPQNEVTRLIPEQPIVPVMPDVVPPKAEPEE
ncbi:MAG: hypothetical protein PHW40_01995 [Candidatus Izemoplasmatales bacterium]|nr:hypothetical protein [Candidatus Izemoplasmatales bacterium]MDD5293068.1 hypothetical protein [Candidatus Izemoplasmatales bacterium]